VLLHAFPASSRMWEPLRSELGSDVELITPDFRGSGGAALGSVAPSLDVLADDVARLLDSRGVERAIIGGLSMGGYVTMAFLRRHAERAAAIVLADTKASADAEPAQANRLRIASVLEAEGSVRVLVDEVLPTLTGETTKNERADVGRFVTQLVEAISPATAAWCERAMAARPDSSSTLKQARIPALVVVGEEDALVSAAETRLMLDALADGRLVRLPKAGHLSAIETPSRFGAAVSRFVSELGFARASPADG
jgi:pimeloyl-ACP methyl ester carboxylesterase